MGEVVKDINEAIRIYIGWDASSFPIYNESRVVEYFGEKKAKELLPQVRAIMAEFNELKPDWATQTYDSATEWVVGRLAANHPELNDVGTSSLRALFRWSYK